MEIKAHLNNLRTAPRKVRQVIDLIRGKKAEEAKAILSFTVNKSAGNILKLLNSAIASATHDLKLEESNLYVSKIFADEGPKLKRWHPMSRGRAYPIIKRSAHISLTLSETVPTEKKKIETVKSEARSTKSETKPKKRIIKSKTKKTKTK